MTQTPLSQEAAAPKPVVAGLRKAGPLPRATSPDSPYHPLQRPGPTAGAFSCPASRRSATGKR